MLARRHQTVTEAVQDALTAMDTKDQMMHWLDLCVTNLSLLVGVGTNASAVSLLFYVEKSIT